jgi:hypothetical protein
MPFLVNELLTLCRKTENIAKLTEACQRLLKKIFSYIELLTHCRNVEASFVVKLMKKHLKECLKNNIF